MEECTQIAFPISLANGGSVGLAVDTLANNGKEIYNNIALYCIVTVRLLENMLKNNNKGIGIVGKTK